VAFDPYNKDHRRYYAEYLEFRSWGKCPVRFIVPEDSGYDLPGMIRASLIQWYIDQYHDLPSKVGPGKDIKIIQEWNSVMKRICISHLSLF
jgi:hypothetical protein